MAYSDPSWKLISFIAISLNFVRVKFEFNCFSSPIECMPVKLCYKFQVVFVKIFGYAQQSAKHLPMFCRYCFYGSHYTITQYLNFVLEISKKD